MLTVENATARCWAEVNVDTLLSNYHYAQSHLHDGTQIMAVLKANAYGLGAARVAHFLRQAGQRLFAVACLSEAMEVKSAVPDADVLVLGLVGDGEAALAIQNGIMLTAFSAAQCERIISAAQKVNGKARAHIKLETGLNRLGLSPTDAPVAGKRLHDSGVVAIEGIFTHLALRGKQEDEKALSLLYDLRRTLDEIGIPHGMMHALDSIGMVRYPAHHMDCVRLGAWLYGVCPHGYEHPQESQLALTLKTRVAQLHAVPAGQCLGYDETHPLQRDSLIATLSAGYMDGFPRLNSQGYVLIHGQQAPVAGLVCMDQMMVDVTDIPNVSEGDEVTLLGGGIGVEEFSRLAHLNHNEALARTGRRVPRVYIKDNSVHSISF